MVNSFITKLSSPIIYFLGTIFFLSFMQWICIQFLATFCSKWTLFGPIENIINLGSPVCHFVNKLQIAIADHYINLWVTAAGAAVLYIVANITAGLQLKT